MSRFVSHLITGIRSRRFRFSLLLLVLFLLIVSYSIVLELPEHFFVVGLLAVDTLTAAVLVASVNIAGRLRQLRKLLLLIGVPVVALIALSYLKTHDTEEHRVSTGIVILSMHALVIVFLSIMMITILQHVLEGGRVTVDEINGAVCVYLLMGLAGAYVFSTVEYLTPGSFELPPVTEQGGVMRHRHNFPSLLYYSLVTLTTLGYGDITPQTPFARTLASMQAVFGQVYLAVLVARLVGIHIAHSHRPTEM